MASSQPRVVVQLANGDALENDEAIPSEQFEPMDHDFGTANDNGGSGEAENSRMAFESPPSGIIPAAPMADDTDSAPETASGEDNPVNHGQGNSVGDRVHPPSSPSPPPSMTPPDHLHLVQAAPTPSSQFGTSSSTTTVYASGHYTTVRSSPISSSIPTSPPTDQSGIQVRPSRPIAPAPTSLAIANSGSAGTVTTVVLAGNSPVVVSNNSSSSLSAAAMSGSPAVIVGTPAGQSPGQAAVQSDHCYGLPYQDHNYGGPAVVPGTGQVSTPGGRPPYPFKVRYPAGYLALQGRDRTSTHSGSEGDAPENFPVIGGLERYLNDEATEPETSPAPNAAVPLTRPVAGDSIAITTYHGRSGSGSSASNGSAREPQYSTSSGSVPYYQRYISPVDYANQSGSPAYSQHLVQIGGRTYIRQTTGPPPAAAGVGNGPLFRNRQDYIGINNPPVLIPPYGGRGRGAQKRAGRPRISRNVSGSMGTYSSTNVTGPGNPAGAGSVIGGPSYSSSIIPGAETGHAPMIAPSKGGRPPGRGRGGARRRTGGTAALTNNQMTNATNSSLPPIKSPDEEKQEKDAFAGLLIDYEKRYDELLNRPLAGSGTGSTTPSTTNSTPRSSRGRGRIQRPSNISNARGGSKMATPPTQNMRSHITQAVTPEGVPEQILTPPSLPKVTVEQIHTENGYIAQRIDDSPEVGPMTALTEQEEDHPVPEPMKEEETQETSHQSESAVSSDEETSSTDTDVEGEWDGTDYVTRCLCGMQHNDEFMISCDKCEVWQHCRCMGIDTRKIPESYLCEKCEPRALKLSAEKAREFQVKKLERRAKEKEKRRQAREKRRAQRKKAKAKRKSDLNSTKETEDLVLPKQKAMDTYHELTINDYTDESKKFVQLHGDTLGADILDRISEVVCQAMYVAPGKWGLVTAKDVPHNHPVAEYRGRICLKSECCGRDKLGRVMTYTLMYSGFPVLSGQIEACGGQDTICVDARLKGSAARFVRRSCRPNTQVKHVIKSGELHLLLVSTEVIERGTEVTIPFDFDFRSSKYSIDCACATTPSLPAGSPVKDGVNSPGAVPGDPDENPCPIQEHNRHLEAKKGVERVRKRQSTETSEGGRRKRPSITAAPPTSSVPAEQKKATKSIPNSLRNRKAVKSRGRGGGRKNTGGKAGGLKVKLAERAKSAVKKAKAGFNNARNRHSQRQAKAKQSPAKSDGEAKTETNELKALKQDFWSSNESPKSPPSRTRAISERSPSDEDSKPLTREERKLQGLVHQIQKMEEAAKKRTEHKSKDKEVDKKDASPAKNKKVTISPKRRRARRWRKGQEKGNRRNRRKDSKKRASEDGESESDIKSETDDEEDEGSAGGASGGSGNSSSGPTTRQSASGANGTPGTGGRSGSDNHNLRGPPRKRWASSSTGATNASFTPVETPTEDVVATPPVRNTPQTGGTKKRWLRQAMSEDHPETTMSSPRGVAAPPKKRLRNGSENNFEQNFTESAISTAEAATVLTQMGLPSPGGYPGAPVASLGEVVEMDTPASPEMQPPIYENPLTSEAFASIPTIPAGEVAPGPIKKRKKVSLDEYKKRKAVPAVTSGDAAITPASAPPGVGPPQFGNISQQPSFIPQMTETDILASGRSFRLGNLPDPEKLGRGTATIEDLKQRIYGRKFIEGQPSPPENSNASDTLQPPNSGAAGVPPPPPPEKPKPANRMSLADRLRTEFGLESEPDPQPDVNNSADPIPPPQGLPFAGSYTSAQISHAPPASIQYHGPPGFPPPPMASIPEMAQMPPGAYTNNMLPPTPGGGPQVLPIPPHRYPGPGPMLPGPRPTNNGRANSAELDDSFEDDRDEGMGPGGYLESRNSDSSGDERGKKRLKSASEEGEISSSDGGNEKWNAGNRQKKKRKLHGSRSRSRSPSSPATKRRGALSEYPYSGPNRYQGNAKPNRSYRSFETSRTEERGY